MRKIIIGLTFLVSASFATTVAFNGLDVTLNSNGLKVGDNAPAFIATTIDFQDTVVGGKQDKLQVLAFVPSLDTNTCELETIAFNKKVEEMRHVQVTIISKDLPFAQKNFCGDHNIKNVQTVSDYKDANNAKRYGTTISAPAFLEGFFGRVVYIVDTKGKIAYVQVVKEISDEPDYDAVLQVLKKIDRHTKPQ
ncbi:MAG: thiol peroxidase [Helicobacteraceae bacterium]|nr:thiol peroxidase [Candidatus Sulfurimonas ponti]MBL6973412.1 thiol peroxidase [Sulfurimonas sp.]